MPQRDDYTPKPPGSPSNPLIGRNDDIRVEVDLWWPLAKRGGGIKEKLAKGTQLLLEKK